LILKKWIFFFDIETLKKLLFDYFIMKVLAAGDIHGDQSLIQELKRRADAEDVDLVILCGDIVQSEENPHGVVGAFKQKVLLIPGNHDSPPVIDFLAEFYDHAKNIHGYGYRKGDVGFFGSSSVNLGVWQLPESEIFGMLKNSFRYIKDCKTKVLVSHVHPAQSKSTLISGFEGSFGLRQAIDELQPEIVLCSHVCEAEGIEEIVGKTRIINVGRKGMVIEI
jgi:uncharacterized protein